MNLKLRRLCVDEDSEWAHEVEHVFRLREKLEAFQFADYLVVFFMIATDI